MELKKIKALSFDCYGTLVDWEAGIAAVLQPWTKAQGLELDREKVLDTFAKVETEIQKEHPDWPYMRVLEEVALRYADRLGLKADESIQQRLAHSVGNWPAFEDTREALLTLKKHFKLVILSNIDEVSFNATNQQQLNIPFDHILTAQKIGSYKPEQRNFRYLIETLGKEGIEQNEILHVAQSLYHDMEPATAMGFPTVWINRRANNPGFGATPPPSKEVKVDLEFPTMGAFAEYVTSKRPAL